MIELDKPIAAPAPKRPKAELVSTLMGVSKGAAALGLAVKTAAPSGADDRVRADGGTGVPSVARGNVAHARQPASIMQTVIGMPPNRLSRSRSPWAAPAATAIPGSSSPAPVAASVVVASPVVAAPVVAAPVAVAAPVVA